MTVSPQNSTHRQPSMSVRSHLFSVLKPPQGVAVKGLAAKDGPPRAQAGKALIRTPGSRRIDVCNPGFA